MAAAVVTGAMGTLLPKLGNLLSEEYKLQKGVKGEIMFLKAELESMETALLEVSETPIDKPPNRQVKLWARDVRELSYDIEDSIDKFIVRLRTDKSFKPHSFGGFIDRSLNLLTKAKIRHKIGNEIKDIKSRAREVSERRDRYKVDLAAAKPVGPTVDNLRLSAMYSKASELIGTEQKSIDLAEMLMDGDESSKQQLKTVSIVGCGGLGKTTIAKVVYDKLKPNFHCGAFVSVSLHPIMVNIFKNMLHQLDRHKYGDINEVTWGEALLIDELREALRDKKYLIVIDDLWGKSAWINIQYALIENECGSRIITTTRIQDVATQASEMYELKPLLPTESTKLFYLRIFGTEDRCPPNDLAKVSENILKKCGGVPLAITAIASMLASKKEKESTHEYWSKVYQSMGSGLANTSDLKDMRRILSISYYDLSIQLRTCLLYLSLYPEDHDIEIQDLIWKWIGEGFVLKEQGRTMYEVGEGYVYELINRSLIQPKWWHDTTKKPTHFRVHDMVLDLITWLSHEDQFLTTLYGQRPTVNQQNKIRRLAIQTSIEEDVMQLSRMSVSHVRSLVVFSSAPLSLMPELSCFPVLRVLDIGKCEQVDNSHWKYICNLFHLRYLVLRSAAITGIPKEIGNLKFLQVLEDLDISGTKVVQLPSSFPQLRQLVHLNFNRISSIPDGFGSLNALQNLEGSIMVKSPTTLHNLCGLTELRNVRLVFEEWDQSYKKPFHRWLSSMVSLVYLDISGEVEIDIAYPCDKQPPRCQRLKVIKIRCTICSVPRWMSSLSLLSILNMELLTFGEEDLQVLGTLPYLSKLKISIMETRQCREKSLVISSVYPFSCLTKLEINNNMDMTFGKGAMQKLHILRFSVPEISCLFGDFDWGLENLSSLEDLSVDLILSHAKPEKVEAAEAALQKAVDMSPNKPRLTVEKSCVVKVNTGIIGQELHRICMILTKKYSIGSIETSHGPGRMKVNGMSNPTTLLEELRKAGIPAEPWPWGVTAPATSGITPTATTSEEASNPREPTVGCDANV